MLRTVLKSKIHGATVSGSKLHYVGSLTVDLDLLRAADILPGELVHVANVSNGARFETYTIAGEAGSGQMQVNGAAARLAHAGDLIIVMSYGQYSARELVGHRPAIVQVDAANAVRDVVRPAPGAGAPAIRSPVASSM